MQIPPFQLFPRNRSMKRVIFLAVLLSGCSPQPSVLKSASIPVVQNASLPPPVDQDVAAATRPYFIAPFDKLSIEVFGVEELTREQVQTDASGRISFPLIGVIEAVGLTSAELAETIEQKLRGSFVRDPQVTVNLIETVGRVVTVDGQVAKPGLYPVMGRMTLQRAVATAGGLSEFADLQDVVVFRTVGGQRMAGLYNLAAIRAGAYEDPEVFSEDIVIVGDSQARRIFKDVLTAAPLITSPLLILFRN